MKDVFSFELKRIFQWKNIFLLSVFLVSALYLVYYGITKYKDFIEEREKFIHYENLKVRQYLSYEQYGAYGFRVLLQPSPLVVFTHSCIRFLESTIDTKETVNISSTHKGQKLFSLGGLAVDFSTIFFVLGSLLMVYFGLGTFPGLAAVRFHHPARFICRTICSRLLVLCGYFIGVILAALLLVSLSEHPLQGQDAAVFYQYALYIIVFLVLFYLLGLFIAVLTQFKKELSLSAYLLWFLLIFVVPQLYNMSLEKGARQIKSNEVVNIKKLANGINFERKVEAYFKSMQEKKVKEIKAIARKFIDEYVRKIIPLNEAIESLLNREVRSLIAKHEKKSILAPSSFYCFLAKEMSGLGYYGYQDFLRCLLHLKNEFYRYYFDKRSRQIDQSVESFIKDNRNIFLSKSLIPANYQKGMAVTGIYIFLLLAGILGGLYWHLKYRDNNPPVQLDLNQLEMGKTYFYLAGNVDPVKKNSILRFLQSQQAVIIKKPDTSLMDQGVSLGCWVNLESQQQRIDAETLHKCLEVLGVTGEHLQQRIKNLDTEVIYASFLGIQLAKKAHIYVFDDFLNRVSRQFEQTCKDAVDKLLPHAVIIYFGSQMFDITIKDQLNPISLAEVEECRFVAVDLNDITLR